ncbi:hypothetical protein [Streptomyces finlayi]|uniref:hypothetical protein n=1 Tax=Streptomyces finlayi TaxID=67296 RepID=UPI0016776348|nr:hypothetical protein [Streptomyces finlayi]
MLGDDGQHGLRHRPAAGHGIDDLRHVAGVTLGAALGALRGATVQLAVKRGALWQRYTGRTFLVVIGTLAVTAGFGVLAVKL